MNVQMITGAPDLADSLKRRRKTMGLSQSDVSDAFGLSRYTLVNAESGRGDPRLSTLLSITEAMGLRMVLVPASVSDRITVPEIQEDFTDMSQEDETDLDLGGPS